MSSGRRGRNVGNLTRIDAGGHRARVLERRDLLVAEHLKFVPQIARSVAKHLPGCFEIEDLIGVGNIALLQAATRYRPQKSTGAPFIVYARQVIRGAMLESVRRKNWTVATMTQSIDDRPPAAEEGSHAIEPAEAPRLEEDLDAQRMAERIHEAIRSLPAAQQCVLMTYYSADEPTLAEAARRLKFPAGKTRELHAAAIEALRSRLTA